MREIIVTFFNRRPLMKRRCSNAEQMLVLGCDSGGYRVLYKPRSTRWSPCRSCCAWETERGRAQRVGIFHTETCGRSSCYTEGKILTWTAQTGAFKELNNGQIVAINGRIGIADVDGDGVLELTAQINPPRTSALAAPARVVDTWDWSGTDYVLALREDAD